MDTNTLIQRLRLMADILDKDTLTALGIENEVRWPGDVLAFEIADTAARAIECLVRERDELRDALKPFAEEYLTFDCVAVEGVEMLPDEHTFGLIGEWPPMHSPMESEFTFGDLRKAHVLLGNGPSGAALPHQAERKEA